MTDYARQCAWCHAKLNGRYIIGPSAFGYSTPEATRYCSARCAADRRSELFIRHKEPGERWPRFSTEIPPELADAIDRAVKEGMGVNRGGYTRAGATRRALRMLLDHAAPIEEPAITSTASDVIDAPALNAGEGT